MIPTEKLELESDYRKYFMEVRGWKIFPLMLPYQAVLEFIEWRGAHAKHSS